MHTLHLATLSLLALTAPLFAQTQGLTHERWNSISGSSLESLRQQGLKTRAPDQSGTVALASAPVNITSSFGARMRGMLTAPVTADYTFFVAGDDNVELWLAHDSATDTTASWNRNLIASHRSTTSLNQWTKFPTQRSVPIRLQAGQQYSIEALMKESSGSDNLSVAWQITGVVDPLAPPFLENATITSFSAISASFTPQPSGNTNFSVASGDIWGSADRGAFYHQPWTGNGVFTIRIGGLNNPHHWAKAGIMLRETLADNSRHVFLNVTPSQGTNLIVRNVPGGISARPSENNSTPWEYLRLTRIGNLVTATVSSDGIEWKAHSSYTFSSLAQSLYVGVAASSNQTSAPYTGWFGPLHAVSITPIELIPGANLTTHQPHSADPLDRGLPDSWMTANSLNPLQKYGDNSPYGDPDLDGLTNLQEFRLGSHPQLRAPAAGLLTREYWSLITGSTVKNLTDHNSFYEIPSEISLVPGVDLYVPSSGGITYGARHRGEIVVPTTGTYRFWITASDHAELWLADGSITPRGETTPRTDRFGKHRIAWIEDNFYTPQEKVLNFGLHPTQRSVDIHLVAGQSYYLEVMHKSNLNVSHLTLAWQTPDDDTLTIIPAEHFRTHMPSPEDTENDGLPDAWETANNLNPSENGRNNRNDSQYGDGDLDLLTNLQEYQYGTSPNLVDTDSDSLSDYDEIFKYGTDPLVPNDLSPVLASTLNVHQYSSYTGAWTHNANGSLSAVDRRGEISYTFTLTQPGVHEVVLTGAAIGTVRPTERLPLVFSLNGASPFASKELLSTNGGQGTVRAITPMLEAGTHTLTILHNNYRAALRLRIDSIVINRLGGLDLDENGIPDWAEQDAINGNTLTHLPLTSRTSPVSIEGITQRLAATALTYTPYGAAEPVALNLTASINSGFYTDVPLSAGGPVALNASFLGGSLEENSNITWIATNLLEFHEGELHIRKNDSLRLTAHDPAVSPAGTFTLQGSVGVPPTPTEPQSSAQPVSLTFNTAGTYTLTATWTPTTGAPQTATVTIHVHQANLGSAFSLHTNWPVTWTPPALGTSHLIEYDDNITLSEIPSTSPAPRSFRASVTKPSTSYLIARLPENVDGAPAAILSRGSAHGFTLAYLDQTSDAQVVHRYADGTWLMRGTMVAINLPSNISIRLTTSQQGTVFHSGSNTLWLNSTHFDSNGIATIYYEWSGTGSPKLCHDMAVFTQP